MHAYEKTLMIGRSNYQNDLGIPTFPVISLECSEDINVSSAALPYLAQLSIVWDAAVFFLGYRSRYSTVSVLVCKHMSI